MIKLNLASYIGKKYGRLTILSFAPKGTQNKTRFSVICDCGKTKIVLHAQLLSGSTKSCGCLRHDAKGMAPIHGMDGTPIYSRWGSMKTRCYNTKHIFYKYYGGRGIKMCEEWKNSFLSFYNWAIANGYKRELQIDRIDNNGNYEPSNCKFVTAQENGFNKRNNIRVNVGDEMISVGHFLKANNIHRNTFYARLRKGWPIEKAMTQKLR